MRTACQPPAAGGWATIEAQSEVEVGAGAGAPSSGPEMEELLTRSVPAAHAARSDPFPAVLATSDMAVSAVPATLQATSVWAWRLCLWLLALAALAVLGGLWYRGRKTVGRGSHSEHETACHYQSWASSTHS